MSPSPDKCVSGVYLYNEHCAHQIKAATLTRDRAQPSTNNDSPVVPHVGGDYPCSSVALAAGRVTCSNYR